MQQELQNKVMNSIGPVLFRKKILIHLTLPRSKIKMKRLSKQVLILRTLSVWTKRKIKEVSVKRLVDIRWNSLSNE